MLKIMAQQQQSNIVKPQKVGQQKVGMKVSMYDGMDAIRPLTKYPNTSKGAGMKVRSAIKRATKLKKQPTMSMVQKSIKKTMGY